MNDLINAAKNMGIDDWLIAFVATQVFVACVAVAVVVAEENSILYAFCFIGTISVSLWFSHKRRMQIGILGYTKSIQILLYMGERMDAEGKKEQVLGKDSRYEIVVRKRN